MDSGGDTKGTFCKIGRDDLKMADEARYSLYDFVAVLRRCFEKVEASLASAGWSVAVVVVVRLTQLQRRDFAKSRVRHTARQRDLAAGRGLA